MDYTVCIAQPPGYIHSAAFVELAELLAHGLADLGHGARAAVNNIIPGSRPIIIGCHLMGPEMISDLPRDTIILNTEQVNAKTGRWNDNILHWARQFETWDYSARNVAALSAETSMPVRHLRLGYHSALARIESVENPDIDVLFYGSINERRRDLLRRLIETGMAVKVVFGVYGRERDELIARSRIVLNMHNYATQIFEIVRVFYLMTNRKAVVTEINPETDIDPAYREGVSGVPYDHMPGACARLLASEQERRALEDRALAAISRLPQAELLAPLLGH